MENMRGYSKMRMSTKTNKPKPMDFSELIHENNFNQLGHLKIMEEEKVIGEQFGEILRRNRSSASQRFRASEKTSSTSLHDVVRRAFSMRRPSSSVAESYWRIHDTGDEAVVHGEDEEQQHQQQQEGTGRSSKRKGKRFFKACKNFLKF